MPAFELLKNYHVIRNDWRELFRKIEHPILLEELFDRGVVCPLQGRSKSGGFVVVTRFGKGDPDIHLIDNLTLLQLTLQFFNEEEATQIYGFIIIHDLNHLKSPRQIDENVTKSYFYLVNHCVPIRQKKIFCVNNLIVCSGLCNLFSANCVEKIKSKVTVGKNYNPLYEYVHPWVLPRFLGGTVSNYNIES